MKLIPVIGLLISVACAPATPTPHIVEQVRPSMGSALRLTAWTGDDAEAIAAFDAVFREFDRLEGRMSVWRDGSDVLRVNAAAGEHPVAISPETREVLNITRQVSDWTTGTFDVTFAALSGLWKFDYQHKGQHDSRSE